MLLHTGSRKLACKGDAGQGSQPQPPFEPGICKPCFHSIGPPGCTPVRYDKDYILASCEMLGQGPTTGSLRAAINLPDGATIWGWRAWIRDMDPETNLTIALMRTEHGTGYEGRTYPIGESQATTVAFSQQYAQDDFLVLSQVQLNHAVDNGKNYYWLGIDLGSLRVTFNSAVIIYTMP